MYDKDKRRHPRLPREEPLSIRFEIPASSNLDDKTIQVYGTSEDMSASGLKVRLDYELVKDQELDIWIVLVDDQDTYNLRGKVTWVQHVAEENCWKAGILLLSESADYTRWDELFL